MKQKSLYILIILSVIVLLFFIFRDNIITSIKWSNDGISVGDIATLISAIIMAVTAYLMYKGNKTSAESVQEMRAQNKHTQREKLEARLT